MFQYTQAWTELPVVENVRIRPKRKSHREPARRAISAVFVIAGIILLCMTETAIACGIAGVACMGAALLVKK